MEDPVAEVARLRALVKTRKKVRPYRSQLDKYGPELQRLRNAGATLDELRLWLSERRINVERSTISRWLSKHQD